MSELQNHPHASFIYHYLLNYIGNPYGAAALCGNLRAESGLYPDRVQGDIPYSSYSQEYTAKVDSGAISEYDFVHNGPNGGGYGLAQWTYYSRKQKLYTYWKNSAYPSIGSVGLAVEYLCKELADSFPAVLNVLKNATSIREASDKVLHDFENPAVQTEAVEIARANMGIEMYNLFGSGTGEMPDTPETPITPSHPIKGGDLSKLLLFAAALDDI